MKIKQIAFSFLVMFRLGFSLDYTYILCEGNFNSTNASLWQLSETDQLTGPIHWNFPDNPLGDVGQNLRVYQDKLYIVMNNSNSLEVMDLADGVAYKRTVKLLHAGPRDIAFIDNHAYITCWYIKGILALNLDTYEIDDTVAINGLPENILANHGKLYVSIAMNSDWSSSDKVIILDSTAAKYQPVDTFTVIPGPNQLLLNDNKLYVLSTYYDTSWNSYTGTSRIDLQTGQVLTKVHGGATNFCEDIALINNKVYRTYNGGVAPLTDTLGIDSAKSIGNYSGIYSMAFNGTYLFLGLSDYTAPDQVVILDTLGNLINTLTVGVCPGSFAFYSSTNAIENELTNANQPGEFRLLPNYPNPFNNRTILTFYLKNENTVQLSIYNLTGELVAELGGERFTSGYHSIGWDGRDMNGLIVPTGMYLTQMKVQDTAQIRKMMFMK